MLVCVGGSGDKLGPARLSGYVQVLMAGGMVTKKSANGTEQNEYLSLELGFRCVGEATET